MQSLNDSFNARQEAIWMLKHIAQLSHVCILSAPAYELSEQHLCALNQALRRRIKGEPLAYIIGNTSFWNLELIVSPAVLVPRLETELLVEWSLECIKNVKTPAILDLGTGSGAIGLAVAKSVPSSRVVGVDISKEALAIAIRNQIKNNVNNINWVCSSWFDSISAQTFDLIISNPPYIDQLDQEVHPNTVRYEPHLALFSEQAGLKDISHIFQMSRTRLNPMGWIAVEHGHRQGDSVCEIATKCGYQQVKTHKDLSGHDRFTVGIWTG